MKEWIDIIRDHRYFNLVVMADNPITTSKEFPISNSMGGMTVEYNEMYPITNTRNLPDAPNYVAVSQQHSYAVPNSSPYNLIPHAVNTPAQQAGNIAFIWGKKINGTVKPFRDDGPPAVIIAVNISKFYTNGQLNRERQHPAIKAEYVAAMWYEKPHIPSYRANGPSSIVLENYKEFWVDGEYHGNRWMDYTLSWSDRKSDDPFALEEFLKGIEGDTNMFSDRYFEDEADEVCYITDFA